MSSEPRVSQFLANFKGGARANRYKVMIDFPNGVGNSTVAKKLAFSCKAAKIPGSKIGIAEAAYMGRKIKFPGDMEFEDWEITVYNDIDFSVRDAVTKWVDKMLGHESNVASAGWDNSDTYMKTATVYQYDRSDNIIKTYTVQGMFPISVAEMDLGYEENDKIQEFAVTFAVSSWKLEGVTS